MSFETKLVYSEPLVRQAVVRYWRRRFGKRASLALLLMAILLVWLILVRAEAWLIGTVVALIAYTLVMMPLLGWVLYRNLMRSVREAEEHGGGNLRVEASGFTASSRVASSTYDWSLVKDVWRLGEVWLLMFGKSQFLMLPTGSLPAEMQEFILQCVRAAGGKVSY